MRLDEFRALLEDDLAWREDEIRQLRNLLLGDVDREEWAVASLRALLVMQYAHLEGFTQYSLSLYVEAVNSRSLAMRNLRPELTAAALSNEFRALRGGEQTADDSIGALTRRAERQVSFVKKILGGLDGSVNIDPDAAVSLEMNLGADVLRKNLKLVGIPHEEVEQGAFSAIEFIRRVRNDIAHGGRKERIEPGQFEAHSRRAEQFMNDLVRTMSRALGQRWYRLEHAPR